MKIKQSILGLILSFDSIGFFGAIALFSFLSNNAFLIVHFGLFVVAMIILFISNIVLNYYFSYYIINDDNIEIHSGFFFKKRQSVPFSNISTISDQKAFLHQLINNHQVSIETNDTMKNLKAMIITNDNFNLLSQAIKTIKKDEPQDIIDLASYYEYKLSMTNLAKSSLANISIIPIIGFFIASLEFIYDYLKSLVIFEGNDFVFIFFLALVFVFSFIFTLIKDFIKFYDYKLIAYEDYFLISYGLLNKKSFKLEKKYINGIVMKQNMIEMLLKIRQIDVINTGYGVDDGQSKVEPYLFIALPNQDYEEIMSTVLVEYADFKTENYPIIKAYGPSFIFTIIICTLIMMIIQQVVGYPLIYNVIIVGIIGIFNLIKIYFNSRYDSLAYDGDKLYCAQINMAALFNFTYAKYIIKTRSVLRVNYDTNPILRLFKAGTISFNILNDIPKYANLDFNMYQSNIFTRITDYLIDEEK